MVVPCSSLMGRAEEGRVCVRAGWLCLYISLVNGEKGGCGAMGQREMMFPPWDEVPRASWFSMAPEFCLLTVMAYSCHMASCRPLHYGSLLGSRARVLGWCFVHAVLPMADTFSMPPCQGYAVEQPSCACD